jgi:hypothetical protein
MAPIRALRRSKIGFGRMADHSEVSPIWTNRRIPLLLFIPGVHWTNSVSANIIGLIRGSRSPLSGRVRMVYFLSAAFGDEASGLIMSSRYAEVSALRFNTGYRSPS